jgi:DNA mismatch endonuclease, patch repair protein
VPRYREPATSAKSESRPYKRIERRLGDGRELTTTTQTSERMGRVRQRATAPELSVRRIAWSLGIRFRTRNGDLPGSPDLANRTRRFAVFVHGCFWHRHRGCRKTTMPKRNREFWRKKFARNIERDRDVVSALHDRGIRTVTIWECEAADLVLVKSRLRSILKLSSHHASA